MFASKKKLKYEHYQLFECVKFSHKIYPCAEPVRYCFLRVDGGAFSQLREALSNNFIPSSLKPRTYLLPSNGMKKHIREIVGHEIWGTGKFVNNEDQILDILRGYYAAFRPA